MNILEALKKDGLFKENAEVKDAISYFYQHRIYISDVIDEEKISQKVRDASQVFLENDTEYDGYEDKAWERFLNSDLDELLK